MLFFTNTQSNTLTLDKEHTQTNSAQVSLVSHTHLVVIQIQSVRIDRRDFVSAYIRSIVNIVTSLIIRTPVATLQIDRSYYDAVIRQVPFFVNSCDIYWIRSVAVCECCEISTFPRSRNTSILPNTHTEKEHVRTWTCADRIQLMSIVLKKTILIDFNAGYTVLWLLLACAYQLRSLINKYIHTTSPNWRRTSRQKNSERSNKQQNEQKRILRRVAYEKILRRVAYDKSFHSTGRREIAVSHNVDVRAKLFHPPPSGREQHHIWFALCWRRILATGRHQKVLGEWPAGWRQTFGHMHGVSVPYFVLRRNDFVYTRVMLLFVFSAFSCTVEETWTNRYCRFGTLCGHGNVRVFANIIQLVIPYICSARNSYFSNQLL